MQFLEMAAAGYADWSAELWKFIFSVTFGLGWFPLQMRSTPALQFMILLHDPQTQSEPADRIIIHLIIVDLG